MVTIGSRPRSVRRQREHVARKRAIVKAASRLFVARGIEATTVEEIARACDLAKGTVYRYFTSKEEIAFALLIEDTEKLQAAARAALDPARPAVAQIEQLAVTYHRFSVAQAEPFRYMFVVPHHSYSGRVAPALLERWADLGRSSLRILADLLQQAEAEGDLAVPNPWASAVAIWSALTGVIVIPAQPVRAAFIGRLDLEQLVVHTTRVLLAGLRPQRPPARARSYAGRGGRRLRR
ncbi:MAG: TetR/AcrR family transcriptional regulator [Deltaproteobacteria bacterium]|nr:TetR/AcrR family transcriptional regulator [Deltaproteobacteria bacterium]